MNNNLINFDFELSVKTTQLPELFMAERIQKTAIVYRVKRQQQGGGFGNANQHPNTWAVAVYLDGKLARINSARDKGREWNSLDRLEKWMRNQGIRHWQVYNNIESTSLDRNQH